MEEGFLTHIIQRLVGKAAHKILHRHNEVSKDLQCVGKSEKWGKASAKLVLSQEKKYHETLPIIFLNK